MPRYTEVQRTKIREVALRLYLRGVKTGSIRQYLAETEKINLSVRQVFAYVEEVRKGIRQSAKYDRDEALGKSLERMEELFLEFRLKGDLRGCLRVLRELNLVQGLITHRLEHRGQTLEGWLRGETNAPPAAPGLPGAAGAAGEDAGGRPPGPGGVEGEDDDEPGAGAAAAGPASQPAEAAEAAADSADLDDDEAENA